MKLPDEPRLLLELPDERTAPEERLVFVVERWVFVVERWVFVVERFVDVDIEPPRCGVLVDLTVEGREPEVEDWTVPDVEGREDWEDSKEPPRRGLVVGRVPMLSRPVVIGRPTDEPTPELPL